MPGFIYAQDPKGAIYVNLYASSETSFTVGGKRLSLAVQSQMPWGGQSAIRVSATEDVNGSIKLRIPGWARNQPVPGGLYSYLDKVDAPVTVSVNRARVTVTPDKTGYVSLDRTWKNGDVIEIEFPMEVRRVAPTAGSRRLADGWPSSAGPLSTARNGRMSKAERCSTCSSMASAI